MKSFLSFLLGIGFTLLLLAAGGYVYLRYGHPPVAAADPSFPMEAQIVHVPLENRIAHEMKTAPFAADESTLEGGAKVYMAQCASCHGTPGQDVPYARYMFPRAPGLWKKHRDGVTGVSDDEPGETYWKVANGIRLTGMPAYQHVLSEEEMWQVTLLLKNADHPLSPAISNTLSGKGQQAPAPTAPPAPPAS